MRPSFDESLPLLKENELIIIEKMMGFSLPKEYRTFILQVNGGFVEPTHFFVQSKNRYLTIERFFGFSLRTSIDDPEIDDDLNILYLTSCEFDEEAGSIGVFNNSFVLYNDDAGASLPDGLPENLFIIGTDGAGNDLMISISGSDRGGVYQYIHDAPEHWDEDENFIYSSLLDPLSFDDLINSAVENPDDCW